MTEQQTDSSISGGNSPPAFDPEREMVELYTEVTRLRQAIKRGEEVNTAGLYGRVDLLCQVITALPTAEARPQARLIGQAIAALDEIEDLISNRFNIPSPRTAPRIKPGDIQ